MGQWRLLLLVSGAPACTGRALTGCAIASPRLRSEPRLFAHSRGEKRLTVEMMPTAPCQPGDEGAARSRAGALAAAHHSAVQGLCPTLPVLQRSQFPVWEEDL